MSDTIAIPRDEAEAFSKWWDKRNEGDGVLIIPSPVLAVAKRIESQLHPPRAWRLWDVAVMPDGEILVRVHAGSDKIPAPWTNDSLYDWFADKMMTDAGAKFLFNIEEERQAREQGPVVVHLSEKQAESVGSHIDHSESHYRDCVVCKIAEALESYREREART